MSHFLFLFFFFNDTATTEIYTLSLHDALPICPSFRDIWRNIPHAYAYSESWRERPTRNLSDTLIFENDFLTLARNSLACNPEAYSDPSGSLFLLLLNRSSSGKITLLVSSNGELESWFYGCYF